MIKTKTVEDEWENTAGERVADLIRKPITQDTEEPPRICQLMSASKYKIRLEVGGKEVDAIVDIGAGITIISEEIYKAMKTKPLKVRDVKLLTA